MAIRQIHLRKLRFEPARKKLLEEIDAAFMKGESMVEIIHGIGTYTLRTMVLDELEKVDYARILESDFHYNPGSMLIELLVPEQGILNKYT